MHRRAEEQWPALLGLSSVGRSDLARARCAVEMERTEVTWTWLGQEKGEEEKEMRSQEGSVHRN